MKRRSSISEGLLDPLFASADVDDELADDALLRAMLDAESALARAEADVGVIPDDAARAIGETCANESFDLAALGIQAQASGNPVVPLVRAIGKAVTPSAKPWVH